MVLKKKICMIIPSFTAKGGITSVVSGYRDSVLDKDYDIKFIQTYCDGNKGQKLVAALKGYMEFIICLMFWKPDIIHIHSSFGSSFFRKLPYIYISAFVRKPIVNHIHGADFNEFYRDADSKARKRIEKAYEKCVFLIALSEEWRDKLSEIVNRDKITVIENYSVLNDTAIKDRRKKTNENTVLFLGFIGERKGCFDIPEIIKLVTDKVADARFVLGGCGEIEKISAMVPAELKSSVIFPGWVRGEDKEKLLKSADIFFLPSYNEGMPMAILDAMGYGLPIVSTNVGGIPRIVKDNYNGFIFDPGDTDGMAKAIANLLINDDIREQFGINSVKIVEKSYSLQLHIKKLSDLYRKIDGMEN